jgi:hypothetical protein
VNAAWERCGRCGLRTHRYAPNDYYHEPTAVACANSIIGLIETTYDEECTRPISSAITKVAYEINQLKKPARRRG